MGTPAVTALPGSRRSSAARHQGGGAPLRRWAVRAVLLMAVLLPGIAEGGLWVRHPLTTVVNLLVAGGAVGVGAALAGDPEQRFTGYVLIASGVTRPLGWADEWVAGPGPLYSAVFGYASITFSAWAVLRFPAPRLSVARRRFMVVLAIWLIGVPAVEVCVARPQWLGDTNATSATWWPYVWTDRRAFDLVANTLMVGSAVLAAGFLLLVLVGLRTGGTRERTIRLPVTAAGMLAAVVSGVVVVVTTLDGPHEEVFAIEGMAQFGVPIAFLVAFAQQRLTRLSTLVSVFDNALPTVQLLREVLRHGLRDPGLELLIWAADDRSYRTVDGAPAGRPATPDREVIPVSGHTGRPLALLVTGPDVVRGGDLVDAAVALSRLALENYMVSRRLLTADYDARQLLVADLHDGAQKDLCALRVALSKLGSAEPWEVPLQLEAADSLIVSALTELRDLAHGVYPHTLTHAGLAAAIEETGDRLDLIVHLTAPERRLPATVERTVYFLVGEALTNVHKHSGAVHVEVRVRHEANLVTVEARDDGTGGADPDGPGLARLRDRIEAHGGALHVDSPPGAGTHVRARIPCA